MTKDSNDGKSARKQKDPQKGKHPTPLGLVDHGVLHHQETRIFQSPFRYCTPTCVSTVSLSR